MEKNSLLMISDKQLIDRLLLLLGPLTVLATMLLSSFVDASVLLRYYAWYVIVVEMLLFYIPTHGFFSGRGGGARFGLARVGAAEILFSLLIGAGVFLIGTAVQTGVFLFFQRIGANTAPFESVSLDVGGGWRLAAFVLLAACIPAYAEEALFRGALLFPWAKESPARGILHCALIFALFQLNPMAIPALILSGLIMGFAAFRSRSFIPAVCIRGADGLLSILAARFLPQIPKAQEWLDALDDKTGILLFLLAGVACAALGISFLLLAAKKKTPVRDIPAEAAKPGSAGPVAEAPGKHAVLLTYLFMIFINAYLLLFAFGETPV